MIQASTLKFLKELKKNNTKEWFDDNRIAYENAKDDFLAFTQELIDGVVKFDNNILKANLNAKNCVTRLNRDVRFSKDKSPYKTNFFAMINQGGKKSNLACYYMQLQPGNSFTGGGVYMPMPPDLQKFRQEIDYNFKEWKAIVENKAFKKAYEKGIQSPETLSRPPKGYYDTNPAIEYLKMKGFFTMNPLTDELLQSKTAIKTILQNFETVKPVVDFLNTALH
jgi:uncharacterized protein (TIGR02453 family)